MTALQAALLEIEPALAIDVIAERFRPTQAVHDVVFCCVDSISSRAAI